MSSHCLLTLLCLAATLGIVSGQLQLNTPTSCRRYGGRCQNDVDCGEDGVGRSNFGEGLCRFRSIFGGGSSGVFNGYCCSARFDLCRLYRGQCRAGCRGGQVAETRYHALCRDPAQSCCFPNRNPNVLTEAPTTASTTAPTTAATTAPTTASTSAPTTAATTAPTTASTSAPTTAATTAPTTAISVAPTQDGCGRRLDTRLFGGFQAEDNEWPWMAAVHLGDPSDAANPPAVTCAGVLINADTILSVDGCAPPDNQDDAYYVTLADRNAFFVDETEQVIQVDEIIRAQNDTQFDSDFGRNLIILKLKDKVTLGRRVSPVCLPRSGVSIIPGRRCFTAGYGTGTAAGGVGPLKSAAVRLLSRERCLGALETLGQGPLTPDTLCSASPAADYTHLDCPDGQGDLGGMLVCEDTEGSWTLLGLIDLLPQCLDDSFLPNLYVNVASYSQWIQEHAQ